MKLPKPSAPFQRIEPQGDSISIDTSSNTLVLPTFDPDILPLYNEFTLTEGRTLSQGTVNFTDDTDTDTGLHNLIRPWIAVYNSTGHEIDFLLFTIRPKNLQIVVSDGMISNMTIYPGNGQVYHGKITHCNPTLDTNSDSIPNCIRNDLGHFVTQDGAEFKTADGAYFNVPDANPDSESIYNFLRGHGMVI